MHNSCYHVPGMELGVSLDIRVEEKPTVCGSMWALQAHRGCLHVCINLRTTLAKLKVLDLTRSLWLPCRE